MVKLTRSMEVWLFENHPALLPLIMMGHLELFTKEMREAYLDWCKTDEGRQYLNGGSKYDKNHKGSIATQEATT